MLPTVDGFLRGEAPDLGGKLRRRAFAKSADAFDEKGLAYREGGRQRIVNGGGLDPSAVPQTLSQLTTLELAVRGVIVRSAGVGRLIELISRTYISLHVCQ